MTEEQRRIKDLEDMVRLIVLKNKDLESRIIDYEFRTLSSWRYSIKNISEEYAHLKISESSIRRRINNIHDKPKSNITKMARRIHRDSKIRQDYSKGVSRDKISRVYDVALSTIYKILQF